MMRFTLAISITLFISTLVFGQITIDSNTLPDIGDQLEYTTFNNYTDSTSYRKNGEDVTWIISDIIPTDTQIESYNKVDSNPLGLEYPDANMIIDLNGAQAAAIRSDRTIEVIGISADSFGFGGFEGIEFDAKVIIDNPFVIRKTPFSYLERIDDEFNTVVTLGSDIIPGLDSLELPIPGASLDSIRLTLDFTKTEEAVGWGKLNILGNSIDVLKVEQIDGTNTTIEIGLSILGFITWIDAGDIFGGGGGPGFGGNQETFTYKFLSADSKRSIVEFTENRMPDASGAQQLNVTGRISAEFLTDIEEVLSSDFIVKVFPNPTSDILNLSFEEDLEILNLSIYNQKGQLIKKYVDQNNYTELNVGDLNSGQYLLRINTANGFAIKQVNILD